MIDTAPLLLLREFSSRSVTYLLQDDTGFTTGSIHQVTGDWWRWYVATPLGTRERGDAVKLEDAYDAAIEAYDAAVALVSDR